jgi:hypothetical protein
MLRTGWLRTFERLERGTAFRLRVGLCGAELVRNSRITHNRFGLVRSNHYAVQKSGTLHNANSNRPTAGPPRRPSAGHPRLVRDRITVIC